MRKIESDASDLEAAFDSVGPVTATKTTTTDIDYKMPEDLYLDGGELLTANASFGDYVVAQVVDVDGIVSPAGTVLKTWMPKRILCPMGKCVIQTSYKGMVLKDLYLRIKYTSVGTVNDVSVAVNYNLHRVI